MRNVVLFDFGGTLDADGDRWAVRFHSAYVAAGGRLGLDDFEVRFRESDRRLVLEPSVRSMGFGVMAAAQAELLRPLLPDGRAVNLGRVVERFRADTLEVVRRNRRALESLRERFRLGVVSNFTGNLDRCLAELDLLPLLSVTVDSAIVGWAKPDPRIFQRALELLHTTPDAAWMVGDNFETDIRPAAALCLGTCWLAPAGRPTPTEGVAAGRIARLTDLPAFLDWCTD